MRATVLVPTYRRPTDLLRCLEALHDQLRAPDEVIVVVRDEDDVTAVALAGWTAPPGFLLRIVKVTVPGVVAAQNAGLAAAGGDVLAIVDDDAAPHRDWLGRILDHFASDDRVGGVGGRDRMHAGGQLQRGERKIVGRLQWWGRVVGFHHVGVGEAREVDVLKGVNCAYRTGALRPVGFDARLRGTGAQVHWELALGLTLRRAGWKLIYDPAIVVEHYPALRFDEDQRNAFNSTAQENQVHNETLALLEHLPATRRGVFGVWSVLVGTREAPGLLQGVRLRLKGDRHAGTRVRASLRGRLEGLGTWRGPPS